MKLKEIENMDEKVEKDVENEAGEPIRTYPRVDKRHACYKILVDSGIDKKEAALILGYKPKSAYEIEKRLEKKGKRIEVTTQKMVRKSVRNLEKLVDAQPFGTLESIKDSTVLAAIQTILDRSHPKHQESDPPTYNFTVVNLDECKPGHPSYKGDMVLVTPDPKSRTDEDP
jgi:hypothetical protein